MQLVKHFRGKTPFEKKLGASAKKLALRKKGSFKQRFKKGLRVTGVIAGIAFTSFFGYKLLDYSFRKDAKMEMSKRMELFAKGTMPRTAFVDEMTLYLPEGLKKPEITRLKKDLKTRLGRKPTRKEVNAEIMSVCREKANELADEVERKRPELNDSFSDSMSR